MGYLRLGKCVSVYSDYCTANLYTNVRGCEGLCGTAVHRLAVRGGGIAGHRKAVGGDDTARYGAVKGGGGTARHREAVEGRWHSQEVR